MVVAVIMVANFGRGRPQQVSRSKSASGNGGKCNLKFFSRAPHCEHRRLASRRVARVKFELNVAR
jgi:hypothetical protein